MMMRLVVLLVLGLVVPNALATESRLHGNPIRRVVTMLQEMQKQVESEGETAKELYDKFMCYCKTTDAELASSIDGANAKISELDSQLEADGAAKAQLDQDVTQHKSDRAAAETSVKESTAMREKEAAEFAVNSGESKSNIAALGGALEALKKGLSASLMQTQAGQVLRNVVAHTPLVSETEREILTGFLQGQATEGGSDQILGIVETMLESMQEDLKEASEAEAEAVASYQELMKAKNDEIRAATKAIESKSARSGEKAVEIATNSADLNDTTDSLADDNKMKAALADSCAVKTREYDARRAERADEVTALSETVAILNQDDSLDTFKKSLPSGGAAAFIQTGVSSRSQAHHVRRILNKLASQDPERKANYGLMLLQLGSETKVTDFEHIVKMIDDMVALLGREQGDDDKQKQFCDDELNKGAEDKAATEDKLKQTKAQINELTAMVENTDAEIETIKAGIADLDTSVAVSTDIRKKEHAEFSTSSQSSQAALELLEMARNRMNKFYNPSMYKAPAPTDAPLYGLVQDAVSFAQVSMHTNFGGEYKRNGGGGGVIQLLSTMIGDVEKDMALAKREEEDGQKEYEETMGDATQKRATDSKLLVTKDAAKAELNSKLDDANSDQAGGESALQALVVKIGDLHSTCDFLLENYDVRHEARTAEIEGLHEGAAVLGAAGGGDAAAAGFLQRH